MDDMRNLLTETVEDITDNKKLVQDVRWVGSRDGTYSISWEQFTLLAQHANYDSGYGCNEICEDLVVVGDDWWLERYEYDGSEWWEFNTLPLQQENSKPFTHVLGDYSIAEEEEDK